MLGKNGWWRRAALVAMTCFACATSVAMAATPQQQVAEHLAAGEFGLAAQVANGAVDANEQAALLQQVATAQQQIGQHQGARGTLHQIATPNDRAQAQGAAAQQSALSGGGTFADFGSLITLIQQNTEGEWEDIDGVGGTATPFQTGVRVSPAKLLSRITTVDKTGQLAAIKHHARQAALNADMAQASDLRFVSLKRLEQEVAARLDQGLPVPESMARMGGLTKVEVVFIDAEAHDIILGGPAEAWQFDGRGEPVGVTSQRPTLQLDDFVVVLRTFATGERDFGCSINTRDAGVQALQDYAAKSQAKGAIDSRSVRNWVNQLQRKLGQQDIVVWGVPHDSRVARIIVEADYRMKLIGIDRLDAGKAIPSYFDLLSQTVKNDPPAMEALRWWLTMKYDAVAHSPDRSVFQIQGSAVLCQSENQMLTAEGKHLPTGKSEPTNRQFAENFTTHYADLAAKDAVFADMQNIFDLALVSAIIRQERLTARAGFDLGVFAAQGGYKPAQHVVPREVDSVVNHRVYNGKDIVVQVAGGVRADLLAVAQDPVLSQVSAELASLAKPAAKPQLPAGRWWWDASK